MPRTELRMPGTSAIVTGSGSGIGRRIASRLATAGVDVVVNDVDEAAVERTESELAGEAGDVAGVVGDASATETADELVRTALDSFDALDIVVNNVGVAGPTKPCEEITREEFLETLEINLGSMFCTSRVAIPHLRRNGGRIVNLSSISGKRPLRDRTPYTTAKMGVIGFTRTLATELAADGVNVNAVCPGSVEGPRLNAVIEGQADSQDRPFEEVADEFRESAPMETFVSADDVADAVLFLCSDRAEKITGQDVNVSAGNVMY